MNIMDKLYLKNTLKEAPLVLAIVGVSGSGKSYLEANLVEEYPDIFHKWQQFSTRSKREGESFGKPYVFVEHETYKKFADKLVARIGSQFGKDKYGSIPDFKDGFVNTVIVSEEGLNDLINATIDGRMPPDTDIKVLGLDIEIDDLAADARREGRDNEFLEKEREVLSYADYIHKTSNGRYMNPKDVLELIIKYRAI
jgi:Guanylate kinase